MIAELLVIGPHTPDHDRYQGECGGVCLYEAFSETGIAGLNQLSRGKAGRICGTADFFFSSQAATDLSDTGSPG